MPETSLLAKTTPDVLLNKGFPVTVTMTKFDKPSATYERHPDGHTSEQWVSFDMESLHAMEVRWGSLSKWEKALDDNLVSTIPATLAIALRWPEQRVIKAMRSRDLSDYYIAVRGAYMIALGSDPKVIHEGLTKAQGDQDETSPPMPPPSESWGTTGESTGPNSGPAGWGTDTTPTSSGDSPSDSSSPPSNPWQ